MVTNHALLAIDALEDGNVLPEHDVVIIDEAHDLVDRVTSIATAELSAPAVEAAARRCGKQVTDDAAGRLKDAGEGLALMLADAPAGRIDVLTEHLAVALAALRDAAGSCATEIRTSAKNADDEPEQLAARRVALAALDELHDAADRMLERVRPGRRRAPGRGVAGCPGGSRCAPPADAAGGTARGRRAAGRAAVRPAGRWR